MSVTTMHQAKTQLSKLVEKALAGEEVIIARGKTPLVKLVPVAPPPSSRIGWAKGSVISMSEDFDAPLEDFKDFME